MLTLSCIIIDYYLAEAKFCSVVNYDRYNVFFVLKHRTKTVKPVTTGTQSIKLASELVFFLLQKSRTVHFYPAF